jgi:hypothetical protein
MQWTGSELSKVRSSALAHPTGNSVRIAMLIGRHIHRSSLCPYLAAVVKVRLPLKTEADVGALAAVRFGPGSRSV